MGNFLRSLFGSKKSPAKIKPRMQSRRLELIGLEERITPAAFSVDAQGLITVQLTANESLTAISASVANSGYAVVTINATSSGSTNTVVTGNGLVLTTATQITYTSSINSSAFAGISILGNTGSETVTIGGAVDLLNNNPALFSRLNISAAVESLNVNGAIFTTGTGAGTSGVTLDATTIAITSAGDITTTGGNVAFTGTTITSAGDITTFSGAINLSGATVAISGAIDITTTGAVIGLATAGDLTFGVISAASVNARSTTGDVIFSGAVTTDGANGFISEATTTATKATKIAANITVNNGANLLLNGNVIVSGNILLLSTTLTGNLTITGKLDSASLSDRVELQASQGTITLEGPVGSTTMGDLGLYGLNSFVAQNTVVATELYSETKGFRDRFAGSVTFSKAVTVSGIYGINFITQGFGALSFLDSITVTNPTSHVLLRSNFGAISVAGAITGKDYVDISSTSGLITLGAISTDQADGDIIIINASGNIATSGKINTLGNTAGITLQTTSGNITTSGEITTAGIAPFFSFTGYPSIRILTGANGLATLNSPIFTTGNRAPIIISVSSAIINSPLTTSGATNAGGIDLEINGGFLVVNQPVTAGVGGGVQIGAALATDVITIAKTAPISSGRDVLIYGKGTINLGASITAVGDPGMGNGINFSYVNTNLTQDVSLKTTGSGSIIYLNGAVDGFYGLTLETPADAGVSSITLTSSVGQTNPLNTVTVTNSSGVTALGNFNASVVLTDTTGTVAFNGNYTTISKLTTAAKGYSVSFTGTTVIAGAPVFLNTGNLSFFGNTSLTSGATITGGPATNINLGGTIVSGGAFNIGAGLSNINISDNTQLILNSKSVGSTFARPINLNAGSAGSFNLLGIGTLTLSADSTAGVTTGDTINVTNGTLNVIGILGSASTITLTNGTLTGPSGTVGNLTPAVGTVDPEGTLNTGAVTFNAATTYLANVLTVTTATNLTGNAGFNLGGATLTLESVASGLGIGNTFTIINNTAPSAVVTGTFAGLAEGATVSTKDSLGNTITFAISYVGGIGANDVTLKVTNVSIANLSAIPQPMVAGQPLLNFFTAEGAGAGGGPMVTVTIDIIPGLTTVPAYFSFLAYDVGFTGGVRVAINELDGNDDTFEIITGPGAGGGPNVKVFQFNIRTLTFNPTPVTSFFAFNDPTFNGGVYVAGGDVTGDGIGDLLVGAGEGGGPRVQVYAGSLNGVITSSPISDFFAYSTEFLGGVVVAAGDRTGDTTGEVITGPASNGGYNIKSFNVAGTGNNPTLIENFFAFNDFTSIGGLSIATSIFDSNPMFDLVVGTTNTQFGVILNQDYEGILANPFPGFTGAIRAGFASSGTNQSALAAAGPGGGPAVSVFSVDPINRTLTQTDSLFVLDPEFTGGLFVAN